MIAKILIIDDDPRLIKCLNLMALNFHFQQCETGQAGLAAFSADPSIDLVLLDCQLPDMEWVAVLKQLRHLRMSIGVILITGNGSRAVLEDCLEYRVNSYIEKPPSREDLAAKIKLILHQTHRYRASTPNLDDCIHDAMRLLSKPENWKIKLEVLAHQFCFCPKYFAKRFKDITGKTFTHYKNDQRMALATAYLKDPNLSISWIAEQLHYQSASGFNRAFHLHSGISPTAYRMQHSHTPQR